MQITYLNKWFTESFTVKRFNVRCWRWFSRTIKTLYRPKYLNIYIPSLSSCSCFSVRDLNNLLDKLCHVSGWRTHRGHLPYDVHLISLVLELYLFQHHLSVSMVTKCTGMKGHLHVKLAWAFSLCFCSLTLKSTLQ